ncbi:MAG: cellulase family glycosylhydrolase [Candidatus Brocadiia bacterium]
MGKSVCALLVSALVMLAPVASAAEWEMRPNTGSGDGGATVSVSRHRTDVVTSGYRFWGADWDYAGSRWSWDELTADRQTFAGEIRGLSLQVEGSIERSAPNQLRFTWTLTSQEELTNIIGGGLEWDLSLDSPALRADTPDPILLEGNRGWTWQMAEDAELRVEFDPALPRVYFEQGNKNRIRTFLVGETFPAGSRTFTMTVTLPPDGEVRPPLSVRYGPADTENWHSGALPHDKSPVDLSFLNHKPAGKHGFVKAEGDRLVFEDGTPARFWAGNIAAYAIYADKENIETQAKRIAQLGYNLMRFHHHDSTAWVGNTVIDQERDDSQHLDPEVMDRLDYWIKCLKDEGVYVWLDLHVGREFKTGDNVPGFESDMDDDGDGAAEGKGFCYYNDRIELLMKQFNEKYLNHVNSYTGLAYKDDPAVMGLLITNENDLTNHMGNRMLPDHDNPYHNEIFEQDVTEFAEQHGLDRDATWRTWVPGPSKLYLSDREYKWNRRMLAHLHGLGVRVPIATTQMWGGNYMLGLPSLTAGGIIDVHSYGQSEALDVNPRYDTSYIHYAGTGQAYGKPVAVTEWNVPYPRTDRFTAPLYMAAISALQGWDAPMIYNYSQRGFGKPSRPRTWSTFPDPAITGMMPAAALAYRRGDVSGARKTYCIQFDRDNLYYRRSHPTTMASQRTLIEQSKVTYGLPDTEVLGWDQKTEVLPNVQVVTDLNQDFIPAGRNVVRSDTGELARNWHEGYQTIDTDRTQAAQGWIGGRTLQLANVTFRMETPKAAVALSSLDGEPIGSSRKVLLTTMARVVASPGGRMPLLSEPVKGTLTVRAAEGLQLVPLAGDGTELEPVPLERSGGAYTIELPPQRGTHWFLLEPAE